MLYTALTSANYIATGLLIGTVLIGKLLLISNEMAYTINIFTHWLDSRKMDRTCDTTRTNS